MELFSFVIHLFICQHCEVPTQASTRPFQPEEDVQCGKQSFQLSTNSLLVVSTIAFQVIRKKKNHFYLSNNWSVSFFYLQCPPENKSLWERYMMSKCNSCFPHLLHIKSVTLRSTFLHLEAVKGSVFCLSMSGPWMRRKRQVGQGPDCHLAFFPSASKHTGKKKNKVMRRALIVLPLSGWRKRDS